MANLHLRFQKFHSSIMVPGSKKDSFRNSRLALQARIVKYFRDSRFPVPKFRIQGSWNMGTLIVKKDGSYDVDLGVFFETKPTVSASTLQTHVYKAVHGQTNSGTSHLQKCIRLFYAGDRSIDLPVFYKTSQDIYPKLANKNNTWTDDDPKALWEWFNRKKNGKGQLPTIVRYFKAWTDERSFKTPSGIALTVWAGNHFVPDQRDDLSFLNTAKAIQSAITSFWSTDFECKNPVAPYDDLTGKLDSGQKGKFLDSLKSLIADGNAAIQEVDAEKAAKLWKKHLGSRFI